MFMLPEKGRNGGYAIERELKGRSYDIDWLSDIINRRGKHAAKTGEGFEEIRQQVNSLDIIDLKYTGRLKPRPVLGQIELTDKVLLGYESPREAWQRGCQKFYAGTDVVVEQLVKESPDIDITHGFESAVIDIMYDRGYELAEKVGHEVNWAIMTGCEQIPEKPVRVLVPEEFRHLGAALAEEYWDVAISTQTFDSYAEQRGVPHLDEEAILADAEPGIAGVYMFVSGSTVDRYDLTCDPIAGAVSRLCIFINRASQGGSMVELSSLKGMYDRYPQQWAAYREVIDTVEETAMEFGFREINTPAIERTELFEVKSGEELLEQTYNFEDKGGRDITLIAEQTPTRARLVQKRKNLKTPLKWFDTSKRWRYEQAQKGRDREFYQTDFDIFGVESVEADAEVIACAATIFKKLNVDENVVFLINDRELTEALLESTGIDNTTEVMKVIDDKEKLNDEEFLRSLENRGLDREQAEEIDSLSEISGPIVETVTELVDRAPDDARVNEAVERMQSLASALETYGVADMCRLDLSIVRGLAYYTGLVFEAFDTEGELRSLFGGGRYDNLVGLFGEQEMPAVGFAFGYSTTYWLLEETGNWPAEEVQTDVYVLTVSNDVRSTALDFAINLRQRDLVVETDLANRSVGNQFSYADSINAEYVIVVGKNDLADGVVTVRNMRTGDEEFVGTTEVVDSLATELA
ncbi:MAG: histidyl-tRNA synthetase [Haloquadratum sp. J07HQX50]|nr:MAG: histidyl-tRNA synthetase [Haloquadratum sp. J07HQX50]